MGSDKTLFIGRLGQPGRPRVEENEGIYLVDY